MNPIITEEMLDNWHACDSQVYLFTRLFGDSAEVTFENVTRAESKGLSVIWLFLQLATYDQAAWFYEERKKLIIAYERIEDYAVRQKVYEAQSSANIAIWWNCIHNYILYMALLMVLGRNNNV